MPVTHEDLRRAELHLEAALRCVAEQRERITVMQARDLDTDQAKRLLATMHGTLGQLRRHRDLIAEALVVHATEPR